MYKDSRIAAIVVAAGKSLRMRPYKNKQYIVIDNRPLLAHTLEVFERVSMIDSIMLVVAKDDMDYCRNNVINKYGIKKVIDIVPGGRERQHSMSNGLKALEGTCDIIVTHDGARPLVTPGIIEESIRQAYMYGAAACAVPVKDTIKVVDSDCFTADTPDRSKLFAVQTPQTFRYNLLLKAHISALEENFLGTDDTTLVERIGTRVKLFEGNYDNIKVTTPEDLYTVESILKYRKDIHAVKVCLKTLPYTHP